jgi:hypothetical protein
VIDEAAYRRILDYIEIFNSKPWPENIGGYSITGAVMTISYTFPPGTILPAGGFAVVARQPATVERIYGITGVFGPWQSLPPGDLPNSGGFLIQLRNRQNAVGVFVG